MKKLLSLLAVAAIVTCTFAFTTVRTNSTFCILVEEEGQEDCAIVFNRKIDASGTQVSHYPLGVGQWDGDDLTCIAATKDDCNVPIKLSIN